MIDNQNLTHGLLTLLRTYAFSFRGDTPFCSEECRRKQIETEKARHRRKKQNSPKAAQARVVAAAVAATAAAQEENAPELRRLQPQ